MNIFLRFFYVSVVIAGVSLPSFSNPSDSTDILRFKRHISSLDYISRKTNNSKYFLNLTSQYCDSILAIDSNNAFATGYQQKVKLTLATCTQNMNHKVELFPFFNGSPSYMGFADDPIEYAYDMALEKLLKSTYIKLQNVSLSQSNTSSIIIRNKCDDEMFEIIHQVLHKNTNHSIISNEELEILFGREGASDFINGNIDEKRVQLLCERLEIDRLGIFRVNDLDVINESIWLVESEFLTYQKGVGFTESIYARGFNVDKRSVNFLSIFLFLLKSILIISIISFLNQNLFRIINNSQNVVNDLLSLFLKKLQFVSTFFIIPLLFSFVFIYVLSFVIPDPEDHYLEVKSKLWMVLITIGISIVPTTINLYFVNRMDIDGFHTLKGYRYFANTSLYAAYFPLSVFFIIQFDKYPIYPHFLLVTITLIIGDLLARSLFRYSSVTKNAALTKNAIVGFSLGILSLLIFNIIILTGFSIENIGYSILFIAPISALYYLIDYLLNKNYVSPKDQLQKLSSIGEIAFIGSLLDPKKEIYDKVMSSITDTELNIMLVSGPAGIGKTRSLKEVEQIFKQHEWDWYYGDCDELQGENVISYEPFLEAFKELLKIDEFTDRGKNIEGTIGKALNIGAAIVDIDSSFISDYQRDSGQSISEICIEIIDKLENRKNKIILVIEDLHWIDMESYAFLKQLIKHITRNKFLRGNMCIIFTLRDDALSEMRGPSYSNLLVDLENLNLNATYQFSIMELLTKKSFRVIDFVKHLSSGNNQFKIQSNSLQEVNTLFNEAAVEFDHLTQLTPLYIFSVLEKWVNEGVLKYSSEGYVLTQNIDSNSLPNNDEVDNYYHTIIARYEDKWKRLLESASVIGNKFNADILAQVWNYELLEVLGFLEKAVNDKLLIDVPEEDNIYRFSDKRIISAFKSYFNVSEFEGDKQIIIEYNKRYVQLQKSIIENPSDYSIEEILSVIRRLSTLLKNDFYLAITKKLVFEVTLRLIDQFEEDKLSGFNDFLRNTGELDIECRIIDSLIEISNNGSTNQRLDEIEKDVFEINCEPNSVAFDLRLYALMLKDSSLSHFEKFSLTSSDLTYIYEKTINYFKGNSQFNLGLLYVLYTYKSSLDNIARLHDFYEKVDLKSVEYDIKVELWELKFLRRKDPMPIDDINERSRLLVEQVKKSNNQNLIESVLSYRLLFLSNSMENDEMAIDTFLSHADLLKNENKITLQWVQLVLNFMRTSSSEVYFKLYAEDAQAKFISCELFLHKIIDFNHWNKTVTLWVDAKIEYLKSLKNYSDLEKLILDQMKRIELVDGLDSLNMEYYGYCIDLATVYEDLEKGGLAIKYRLIAIDILKKKTQSNRILKRLASNYSNISQVYRTEMSDGNNAVLFANKALEIREKFEYDNSYGFALFQLARALDFNEQYKDAAKIYTKALPYFDGNSKKQIFKKLVVELRLGLTQSQFDVSLAKGSLKKVVKEITQEERKIYVTDEIQKFIDLAKKILSSP
jgi:hypothetical protein